MAKTYEISFKLGAQMAGNFAKTMTSAGNALGQLNKHIGDLNNSQSSIASLISLRQQVANSSREYIKARQNVAELGRAIASTDQPTKEMTRNFEYAKLQVKQAKDRLTQQRQELSQLNTQLGTTGKSTKDLIRDQEQMAAAAKRAAKAQASLSDTMAKQQANLQRRGDLRGQLFDTAALAATFAAPIRAAMQFESAMADVNKVVDQTTEQSAAMGQEIMNMSRQIPIAANGLAEIVAAGGQAGIARKDLLGFAESAAKMGVAFDITAGQAGEMMAKWRTAFGLTQTEVTALADQINYLSNTSAASAPAISDVVTRVGGLGKLSGLSSGEVAAMASALVAVGAPSEVAATGLQNMMLAMTAGKSATNAQKQAFAELGFEAQEMAAMMQNDAQGAILSVLSAVQALDAEERPAVLTEIFGKESIKSIGQLVNQADLLKTNFNNIGDASIYAGSMQKEFAARSATTQNNMQLLSNRVNALGISLGNILLPGVNAVVGAIGPLIDMAANMANNFPVLTSVIVGTAAALAGMKIVSLAAAYAWTFIYGGALQVIKVLQIMRTAWLLSTGAIVANTATSKAAIIVSKGLTAAQWLLNAAMAANPIGLIIVGIGALISAGLLLWANWEKVSAFFVAAWAKIKSLFSSFNPLGWMKAGFNSINSYLSKFSLYNSGKKILSTLASGIKSAAMMPINAVKNVFNRVRKYLPFSDAKVGPFSQLTASGAAIMKTLGDGMKAEGPTAMTRPLGASAAGVVGGARSMGDRAASLGSATASGFNVTVTQQISIGAGVGADVEAQARAGASAGAAELVKKIKEATSRERRLSFA